MKLLNWSLQLLKWGVLLLLAVIMVAFAVANRQLIIVRLDPLPAELQPLPLFVIVFAAMLVGLLLGGGAAWWRGLRWRRRSLQERQRADRLARDLDQATRGAGDAQAEKGTVPRVA